MCLNVAHVQAVTGTSDSDGRMPPGYVISGIPRPLMIWLPASSRASLNLPHTLLALYALTSMHVPNWLLNPLGRDIFADWKSCSCQWIVERRSMGL